ncbi:MAG: acetylglutamate kinase [Chloroflexi bacterium]|nr:acetylglutamate kinase [Chloroflexota bacterium]
MKNGKKNTIVIKIGGSTLGKNDSSLSDIIKLSKEDISPIIIHGGGKEINKWIAKQGIHPEFINGLRRTDKDTRDVAASVLSGLINNTIVSEIQILRGNATGLSGISNSLFECKLLSEELGYVGEIIKVNSEIIKNIINSDSIPVIAPLGINIYSKQTDDNILNINADTAASFISNNMRSEKIIFLTDVEGVLDHNKRLISKMTKSQATELLKSGIISGGMIPKIEACLNGIQNGGSAHIIDGRDPGALLQCIENKIIGTKII